jgi:hypothetical protein
MDRSVLPLGVLLMVEDAGQNHGSQARQQEEDQGTMMKQTISPGDRARWIHAIRPALFSEKKETCAHVPKTLLFQFDVDTKKEYPSVHY